MRKLLFCTLLAAASLAAQGLSPLEANSPKVAANLPPPPTNALDKADFEFYVRHLYVWGPQISVEVGEFKPSAIEGLLQTTVRVSFKLQSQDRKFYVSQDGKHVVEGTTYEIDKNPFHDTLETIKNENYPGFGKEGAPIVIAMYSDFQCPYCAQEAKLIRDHVEKEFPEDVRVYFHDFPLPTHDWAMDAAIAGRCIYNAEPQKFWAFHDSVFENQRNITKQNLAEKVGEFAQQNGLDSLKLTQCAGNEETRKRVEESIEQGRAAGVTSTPTMFLNGRRLSGAYQWDNLKQIIEFEIEYQKVTHNAGDDCGCAVTLPFPQNQ